MIDVGFYDGEDMTMRIIVAGLALGLLLGMMPGCSDDADTGAPPPPRRSGVKKVVKKSEAVEAASADLAPQKPAPPPVVPKVDESKIPPVPAAELPPGANLNSWETESLAKLRFIVQGLSAYHKAVEHYPAQAIHGKEKPLLSWRVALLPYLGQAKLFSEFNLTEPWDSPTNKRLVAKIPPVYQTPGRTVDGKTCYLVPVGPGTIFGSREGMAEGAITDGKSKTLIVVEADEDRAVTWTEPEDLAYSALRPFAGLGMFRGGKFLGVFADGKVRAFPTGLEETSMQALFSTNGRELVELPALDRAIARMQPGMQGIVQGIPTTANQPTSRRQNEAVERLAKGDLDRGVLLLQVEAARGNWDVLKSMQWSKALKRPMFVLRCGVAVQGPGVDSAPARGPRKTVPQTTLDALSYWHAEVGGPVLNKLQMGVVDNRLGTWMRESVTRPANASPATFAAGDKSHGGAYEFTSGILNLGLVESMALAKRAAAKEGLDVLIFGAITIKVVRVRGEFANQSTFTMRVIDVVKDEVLWSSKPINSDIAGPEAVGADNAAITRKRMLDDLLNMLDEELFLSELPTFSPEVIQRRANALVEQADGPLPVLAELRYYSALKLLSPDQLAAYFSRLIGPELGVQLANGPEVGRQKIVEKLLQEAEKADR